MSGTTRHRSAVGATVAGLLDRVRGGGPAPVVLADAHRLDDLPVLVTGANRGLGRGISEHLAARGARLFMACRSHLETAPGEVAAAAGVAPGRVVGLPLDLTEMDSIDALARDLADRGVALGRVVLNAGVVPLGARTTGAGLDVMFHVNFLANVALIDSLLEHGVLAPADPAPRIVVVGSDAHRSAPPLDLERFGEPWQYGAREAVGWYGVSKLHLHTWAVELGRRVGPGIEVHHLCPGAVDSDIAREAPGWVKPVLSLVMRGFFQSPASAAEPAVWLCAAPEVAGETGVYLHLGRRKPCADTALDPAVGASLWDAAQALVADIRGRERPDQTEGRAR